MVTLRANPTANHRQGVVHFYLQPSFDVFLLFDQVDKFRDFYGYRAAFHTKGATALQTAFSFRDGLFFGETESYLFKIVGSVRWLKLRHTLPLFFKNFDGFFYFRLIQIQNFCVQTADLVVFISAVSLNNAYEVDQMTIKFGTVNTGELCLLSNLNAAATAHTGAIHHNRVQAHYGWDLILACQFADSPHHQERSNRQNPVKGLASIQQFL